MWNGRRVWLASTRPADRVQDVDAAEIAFVVSDDDAVAGGDRRDDCGSINGGIPNNAEKIRMWVLDGSDDGSVAYKIGEVTGGIMGKIPVEDRWLNDLRLFQTASGYNLRLRDERRASNRDLERFFFKATRALNPDLFIEPGANDAVSSRRARRYLPSARIMAFEANPVAYDHFNAAYGNASHRVEYIHKALSDRTGVTEFFVHIGADGQPISNGQASLLQRLDGIVEKKVSVECAKLDDEVGSDFHKCAI